MIYSRRLPLQTLYNARDLGGIPLSNGKTTNFGKLIRSELPDTINSFDKAFLNRYGVTASIDFRGEAEISVAPSLLCGEPWLKYIHNPLWSIEVAHGKPEFEIYELDDTSKTPEEDAEDLRRISQVEWIPVYIAMAEANKDWVKRTFEYIAAESGCVHYHCMTGKDRTGILTAMLLKAAGAADEDVIADYAVSQIYLRPFYTAYRANDPAFTGNPDLTLAFYRTHPETMEGFLNFIYQKYGDMRAYIDSCGIGSELYGEVVGRLTN
ncbi:MAG: tyrosine-protein phosphatase [Oscillospiraceae bacterium]|jgi:protein-tyrosine phosphatase|nr:tyrosine-protein phosphatase [Oscillospiraceae bacterium]